MDGTETDSIRISWVAPMEANSPITFYLISACNLNSTDGMVGIILLTNDTRFNITGLLPGTTYEMTVVAVSQGGDIVARSEASDLVIHTTDSTGESVKLCVNFVLKRLPHLVLVQYLLSCVGTQASVMEELQVLGHTSTLEGYL